MRGQRTGLGWALLLAVMLAQLPGAFAETSIEPAAASAPMGPAVGTTTQARSFAVADAVVSKSINLKLAKPGDKVTARLRQGVVLSKRLTLGPDTQLIGRVTFAQSSDTGNGPTLLAIRFDRAMKFRVGEIPLEVVIQAVISMSGLSQMLMDPTLGESETDLSPAALAALGLAERSPPRARNTSPAGARKVYGTVIGVPGASLAYSPELSSVVIVSTESNVILDRNTHLVVMLREAQ